MLCVVGVDSVCNMEAMGRSAQEHMALAALTGNIASLRHVLQTCQVDVNEGNGGPTPLFVAVIMQRKDMLELLLQYKANPGQSCATVVQGGWMPNADGVSYKQIFPLEKAVEVENMEIIEVLLRAGARPNQYHKGMQGLLILATKHERMTLIRWLDNRLKVEEGLWNVNWAEPLMMAIKQGNRQLACLLIQLGADPNKEFNGLLPLTVAANNSDFDMCQCLLKRGAQLNGARGTTLGTKINPLSCAILTGQTKALPMLIHVGCRVNESIDWSISSEDSSYVLSPGASMLHIAVLKKNIAAIGSLIDAGCNINGQDSEGNTPLHIGCYDQNGTSVVLYLLTFSQASDLVKQLSNTSLADISYTNGRQHKGKKKNRHGVIDARRNFLDINSVNHAKNTPLMCAVKCEHSDAVKLLITAKADVNKANYKGLTALHEAMKMKNETIFNMLLEAGAVVDVLDKHGCTPLIHAIKNNDQMLANLLIEAGADINIKASSGENLLHFAISANNKDLAQQLLEKGFDVNERTPEGDTPLTLAAKQHGVQLCQLLTTHGALINLCDRVHGETALSLSIYFGEEANARWLIMEGADLNQATKR